jgi:hypothetical protein
MEKFFQLCLGLFLLISVALNTDAQKKITKSSKSTVINNDYTRIIKPLFQFFEFDNSDLTEVIPLYFENAPAQFKKQFINRIKSVDRDVKIRILTKKEVINNPEKEIGKGEAILSLNSNQRVQNNPRKGFYLVVDFTKRTKNLVSISVASYSPCYSTGETYTFKKNRRGFARQLDFISECLTGNCVDSVCLPMKDDEPPPPKLIKP